MNNFNVKMFLLALLVISMFALVGISIAFRNIWAIALFLFLGFAIMGLGISLKRKKNDSLN